MQVAQAEVLGIVNDDRVRVRHVHSRFDDRSGYQHVELPVNEVHHQLFELLRVHLPVPDANARFRAQLPHEAFDVADRLDAVVDEIDLPVAGELVSDRFADDLLVEQVALGGDRLAVRRRR